MRRILCIKAREELCYCWPEEKAGVCLACCSHHHLVLQLAKAHSLDAPWAKSAYNREDPKPHINFYELFIYRSNLNEYRTILTIEPCLALKLLVWYWGYCLYSSQLQSPTILSLVRSKDIENSYLSLNCTSDNLRRRRPYFATNAGYSSLHWLAADWPRK